MARHPILSEQLSKRFNRLFKRTSRRVAPSRGKRVSSRPSSVKLKSTTAKSAKARPSQVSTAQANTPQSQSAVKSGKFWSNLFWVRPWLLVVALWLTFVLMIAIALAGLSNPGREMALAPITSSTVGQPLSAPDAAAVSRLGTQNELELTQHDPAATLPGAAEKSMPAWPLLLMVTACAGGCLMVSRQGLLTAEPRRGRRRAVTTTPPSSVVRSGNPVRSTGKRHRRAKHRRLASQRPASQVMAFDSSGQKLRHTPPQTQRQSVSKSVSFAVNNEVPPSVAVVPDNETSPLDWKEGSLAHKLDVRQNRSINSFL